MTQSFTTPSLIALTIFAWHSNASGLYLEYSFMSDFLSRKIGMRTLVSNKNRSERFVVSAFISLTSTIIIRIQKLRFKSFTFFSILFLLVYPLEIFRIPFPIFFLIHQKV